MQGQWISLWPDSPDFAACNKSGAIALGCPYLIRPRLGQGAFRVLVTDIY
jgi:hypothetical protein